MSGRRATVVLVHGIMHGAWCWERVTTLLECRGIDTIAVDRRRGDPKRVISGLRENAELIEAVLDQVDGPVVLVGHSAGCRMITETGLHPSVRHLVYIAGLMPGPPDDPLTPPQRLPQPSVQLPDGSWAVEPEDAKSRFFTELDDATASWAAAQLSPQAPPFPDPADNPTVFAWQERPSTYVMCAKDATVDPGLQREIAPRASASIVLESGHSPFLSHPVVLADLLESLAAG